MTIKTEGNHTAEFLLSEGEASISREVVTIISGQNLVAGTVLGAITTGASAAAVAAAGNTGDGTMGAITVGAGAKFGDHKLTIIEAAANGGAFQVEGPDGKVIGTGKVGVQFAKGGLTFTLADGAADFVAGDLITITVAAGSGKYKAYNSANTDGSQDAAAVLYAACDATGGDQKAVVVARLAEVSEARLTGCDAGAKTALATRNIIVR